jgi:UDP-N-acetyl-D-mannosaminuronate dehydrogenase
VNFIENLMRDRLIGIWGMGYLAYTFMLKLQANHFSIRLTDLSKDNLHAYEKGSYPVPEQIDTWSSTGQLPSLNFEMIEMVQDKEAMFTHDLQVHIICVPSSYLEGKYGDNLVLLAESFRANANSKHKPLIIFQSASGPGSIERDFLKNLDSENNNYFVGSAFRSDWSIEEFLSRQEAQVVSGVDSNSIKLVSQFYDLLRIESIPVPSLRDAELLENAKNALEFTVSACLNELAQAYPGINLRKLAPLILKGSRLDKCLPGLGTGGFRMPVALDNLIRESPYSEHFSLIKEAGLVNFSSMMLYVDYLIRKNYKKVVILGGCSRQDLVLPPALIIAQGLSRGGMEVWLHGPRHNQGSLDEGFHYFQFPTDSFHDADVIMLTSDSPEYRLITQAKIDALISGTVKLIIDGVDAWNHYDFGDETKYHRVGDGSLDLLD